MSDVPTKIVNRVVDSLDVRLFRHAAPSVRLMRDAEVWRGLIASYEPGDPAQYVQLPGLGTFRIKMGGHPPYEFVLINPQIADIRVWNVNRWNGKAAAQTGQLYVSFRSVFLQRYGVEGARSIITALCDLFCSPGDVHPDAGPEFDRIARVDLAVDTQERRDMKWGDLDRFVCRARKLDTWAHLTPAHVEQLLKVDLSAGSYLPQDEPDAHDALPALARSASRVLHSYVRAVVNDLEQHGEASLSRVVSHNRAPQTVYFGRFGSQLYARRYNKLGSLVVQNKLYMLDIWQENGWDGDSPVWRTEFSLSGDFLKGYRLVGHGMVVEDCRDLSLLESVMPVVWDYLVTDWLRMTDPLAFDKNHRRWPTAREWGMLQGAFGEPWREGERDHSRTVPREDRHLVQQARGCSVSTVALRSAALGSVDAALESIVDDLVYKFGDDEFRADVSERLLEFGLDDFTDTALSAMFRRERLKEAVGS